MTRAQNRITVHPTYTSHSDFYSEAEKVECEEDSDMRRLVQEDAFNRRCGCCVDTHFNIIYEGYLPIWTHQGKLLAQAQEVVARQQTDKEELQDKE